MTRLLSLPSELIVFILTDLNLVDILSCCRTNKYLYSLLSWTELQYKIESEAAGVVDNPRCKLTVAERLDRLRRRERNWGKLEVEWKEKIPIVSNSSTIFELESGYFLLGDASYFGREVTTAMTLVNLNSANDRSWGRIDVENMAIIDVGVALEEHDLVALVTFSVASSTTRSVDISLLNFSTRQLHKKASKPRLHITNIPAGTQAYVVAVEIAGEHLSALVQNTDTNMRDILCVFNWKTGENLKWIEVDHNTYQGVSFLRPGTLILLNMRDRSLDLIELCKSKEPFLNKFHNMIQFEFPPLAATWNLESMSMRAGPKPQKDEYHQADSDQANYSSDTPFQSNPENALVLVNFSAVSRFPVGRRHFSFVLHRHALVEHISPQNFGSHVRWSSWGFNTTRWFNSDLVPMWWPVATHGQRYVRPSNSAPAWPAPVRVLDFNPYTIRKFVTDQELAKPTQSPAKRLAKRLRQVGRKLLRQQKKSKPVPESPHNRVVLAADDDGFDPHGVFEEDLLGTLPYFECTSQTVSEYDGVLIDEERLVGLRMGDYEGPGRTVEILHFG